jgi:hypothetical protein
VTTPGINPRWLPAGRLAEIAGCLMWLGDDQVMRCVLAPVTDDLFAARRFLRTVVELGGGPATPIGFQLCGLPAFSQSERLAYLASTEAAAIAFLVESSEQLVMARRLSQLVAGQCPSRVFTRSHDADRWMRTIVGDAHPSSQIG